MAECPCGSGRRYEECCGRYIEKGLKAPTAEALMRSRFTAYAMRISGYIVSTALNPPDSDLVAESMKNSEFVSLEILSTKRGGALDKKGVVEFRASYVDNGAEAVLHERSAFVKRKGVWLYDEENSVLLS